MARPWAHCRVAWTVAIAATAQSPSGDTIPGRTYLADRLAGPLALRDADLAALLEVKHRLRDDRAGATIRYQVAHGYELRQSANHGGRRYSESR